MYIAMNRFQIAPGRENDFETVWRDRKSMLDSVPGFLDFKLLRGDPGDKVTIVISHSTWASEEAFREWTNSEAFRTAHQSGKTPSGVVLGPPQFEGYQIVMQTEGAVT